MLTKLKEKDCEKSEKYWPKIGERRRWGEFLIENISTKIFSNFCRRKLQVNYKNKTHLVYQFQYVSWPEQRVPLDPRAFITFNAEIRKKCQNSPIVVHCSAGCGRTGTYILCDIILQMGIEEQKVDFLKVLQKMRQQRLKLVTNVQQYVFAHSVVLEYFCRKDFSIAVTDTFQDDVHKVSNANSLKILKDHIDKVVKQYEQIKFELPFHVTNVGNSQIFPLSSKEIFGYINAVSVDCYRCQKKFIVIQQPLRNNLKDFWTLIDYYNIDTIVSLNKIIEPECSSFWPRNSEQQLSFDDSLKISFLKEIVRVECNIVKVEVGSTTEKKVNIIKMKRWKREALTPSSVQNLIQVWEKVTMNDRKVLVTCYDGATASGLFVALAYLLEKINVDQVCDVFSAVKTVKQSRSQFVQHVEQLEFLYEAALEYIQEFKK